MFDIFNIRKRRMAKKEAAEKARLEQLAEKKRVYQERKSLIDSFLKDYRSKLDQKEREEYREMKEWVDKRNSKCPKCGSTNVINQIRRTEGEVHGSGKSYTTSSSSHFLFGSSSSFSSGSSSKIDGKLDTLPVNRCRDCGNEWNVEEAHWKSIKGELSNDSYQTTSLFNRIKGYLDLEYDPEDIKDKFNSLEEKREAFSKDKPLFTFDFYETLPKYMLDYALWIGMHRYSSDIKSVMYDPMWGVRDDLDEYSYQMPPELWEICKKVIGWKGNE